MLTKPFQPGQDRLAGLDVKESPASGCPVLADASAHIDCEVVTRMDAADHWVVYAKVIDGAVDDDTVLTAVRGRGRGQDPLPSNTCMLWRLQLPARPAC